MMTAIFATMLLALVLERFGPRRLAVPCLLLSLCLSVGLFLWEVYSPAYGFRMPWLKVEAPPSTIWLAGG
jgi:hypothetical protein